MQQSPVDYSDVQGLARFGYSKLTEACFLLLAVRDAAAARAWLATAPVSNAVAQAQPPDTALQLALTADGLRALHLPADILAGFSSEFLSGLSQDPNRSRRLGDVAANAPANWEWGRPGSVPHLVLLLYAKPGQLAAFAERVKGPAFSNSFDALQVLPTSNLDNVEPFGFTDGISQPALDWDRKRDVGGKQLTYSNLTALGEFLLGYPNEYGKYTDRPLLPRDSSGSSLLSPAEDAPDKLDLGKNGAYLVLRTLDQDVRGFWRFVDKAVNGDPHDRQKLAEAMVGRTIDGNPLVPMSQSAIPGIEPKDSAVNQFTYDGDPDATRCPFGAHVRRSNPRNGDLPPGITGWFQWLVHTLGLNIKGVREDVVSPTRFHRLLRRGREYGPGLSVDQALAGAGPDPNQHGIQFICLNANITRQFEFVQNSWLMSTKFNGLTEESDPLLGNRQPIAGCPFTDTFSLPQPAGLRQRITGVPQFIRVRGGAYFFMPSLSALRYLSQLK